MSSPLGTAANSDTRRTSDIGATSDAGATSDTVGAHCTRATTTDGLALAVIAKSPMAGRAKTRLCPPCSGAQAARLAEAALLDTLSVMARTPAGRRVLVLDREPAAWLAEGLEEMGIEADGFEVILQCDGGLAARLARAFADIGETTLLVGMDTPQITPSILAHGLRELARPDVGAVLGAAEDGGYWAIGLREFDPRVFEAVPMSTSLTADLQLRRLRALGLRTVHLGRMRDVDNFDDALAVAAFAPHTHFAAALAATSAELARAAA